jgi:hypothetical protein
MEVSTGVNEELFDLDTLDRGAIPERDSRSPTPKAQSLCTKCSAKESQLDYYQIAPQTCPKALPNTLIRNKKGPLLVEGPICLGSLVV